MVSIGSVSVSPGQTIPYAHRVGIEGLSGVGQTFNGTVYYQSPIGGAQEFDFTAMTMHDPDTAAGYCAKAMRTEMPPRFRT